MKKLIFAFLLLLPLQAHAIIYVVGTASAASGGVPAPTMPTNAPNDILIIAMESGNDSTITAPAGYSEIDSQASMSNGSGLGAVKMAIFWKRSTGSESTPTLVDTGDHTVVILAVVRGVIATGNPWDVVTCGVQATASTAVSWQSAGMSYGSNGGTLTTTVDGTFIVGFIAEASDSAAGGQFANEAVASLNNVFEDLEFATAAGNGGGLALFTGIKPGAGVVMGTSGTDITATLLASVRYSIFVMALKPANPSAPIYIGKSSPVNAGTALTVVLDMIYAANDVLVLVVETGGAAIASTPAGWASFGGEASTVFGTSETTGAGRITALWLRATSSSETNPAVGDSGDHQIGQVFAFRNCIATGNPMDVRSEGQQATTNTSLSWQSSGFSYGSNGATITTTAANTLVMAIAANAVDSAVLQTSGQTLSNVSNFNPEVSDVNTSQGFGGGFSLSAGDLPTAGTVVDTGSNNFTAVLATTSKYGMQIIAVKPVVTGPTAKQKAAFFYFLP